MQFDEEHCAKCPGYAYVRTRTPGGGNADSKLIVIGEGPGASEVGAGKPFVGRSGNLLWNVLSDLGHKRDDFYVTNACKCFITDPPKKVLDHCKRYLSEEMALCGNKTLIIALGNGAKQVLNPKERKGITHCNGKIIFNEEFNCNVLNCIHPAAILRDARQFGMFRSALEKIVTGNVQYVQPKVIQTEDLMWIQALDGKNVALDLETTGLDYLAQSSYITHVGLYDGEQAYVYPGKVLKDRNFLDALENLYLVTHNGSFDIKFLKAKTGRWFHVNDDTMLMGYMNNEGYSGDEEGGYSLERLAVMNLGAPSWKTAVKKKNFDVSTDEMAEYLSLDVFYTYKLWELWRCKMPGVYRSLLIPAFNAKSRIEFGGVNFDKELCLKAKASADRKLSKMVRDLQRKAGNPKWNVNSAPQNKKVFEKVLGKPVKSTDEEFLLKHSHISIFNDMLKYRKLKKLASTYMTPKYVGPDGHVHTNFNLHRTVTGRLSSSQPNLQNVPRALRRLYIPDKGHEFFLEADYSQLEYKVAVALSGAKELRDKIERGFDFHTITSMLMTGKNPSDISKDERRDAKEVNFGVLFGMGMDKLARLLKCSLEEAEAFRDKYFSDFKMFRESVEAFVLKNRYVETVFGRKRRFAVITKENIEEVYRESVSTVIQSPASDIMLSTVVILVEKLPMLFNARVVNTVHDSVGISSPGGGVQNEVAGYVNDLMQRKFHFTDMTFSGEVEIGRRWK